MGEGGNADHRGDIPATRGREQGRAGADRVTQNGDAGAAPGMPLFEPGDGGTEILGEAGQLHLRAITPFSALPSRGWCGSPPSYYSQPAGSNGAGIARARKG